jgi:glycerate-2-kinase
MARTPRETLLGGIVPEILRAADPAGLVAAALGGGAPVGRCRAVAVGKAAAPMVRAAAGALGERLDGAVVVAPTAGDQGLSRAGLARAGVEWLGADHPTPTPRSLAAAGRVREFVEGMAPGQTLLVLLSGGASAMLCLPREPLTLADIASVTDALLRAGAPIGELNAVRKHCEVLKGGGLAAACSAGRIVSLILSDVLGDRLDVIGSGPTAPDQTTFADALGVLERRGALDASPAATALLRRGAAGAEPETVKPGAPVWARVENRVIGNNRLALDAAAAACGAAGYPVVRWREGVEGEAAVIGRELAAEARRLAAETGRRAAIVWGGETTVTVGEAPGLGGRNQELALACAIELDGVAGVTVLSLATDGRDGPTDAAGGVVDGSTARAIRGAGVQPRDALARHDSYHALDRAGALLRTGPTGTNINDLMVALVG